MAPQKFASVRYKSRPAVLVPFRDDSNLVAFKYEDTIQAEPPIILPPPRNPLRAKRPLSSIPSSPATPLTPVSPSSPLSPASTISTASGIIVVPPPGPPPQEQHPALRVQIRERTPVDDYKRDSGLASTSSGVTIREECEGELLYNKIDLEDDAPSAYSRARTISIPSSGRCTPDEISPVPRISCQSHWSVTESDLSEVTPTKVKDASRRLAKTFSLRNGSPMKRLRKKSLSEDAAVGVAPESRGSTKPKSPKLPNGALPEKQQPPCPKPSGTPAAAAAFQQASSPPSGFIPLTTTIPRGSFLDDDFITGLTFSKRGSLMFGSKRANGNDLLTSPSMSSQDAQPVQAAAAATGSATEPAKLGGDATGDARSAKPSTESPRKMSLPNIRVLSVDTERESQKVRSLYDSSDGIDWKDGGPDPPHGGLEPTEEAPSDEEEIVAYGFPSQLAFRVRYSMLTRHLFSAQRVKRPRYHPLSDFSAGARFVFVATR
ncbi:putative tbc domain-containing protein [Phaeoacremonium minimum UCRPA7]|uniref:Putative tbc domain-containing protein n=1 Tax=Phaeoacremonium minimum (strain UCR-PA7) TaxID=1286976 RepID=R8BKX2_PHAM7|nr:putative tbc domain-containing protein [Phaeoacremonium minimum UCRPA7]EOO00018.1 putative tbc domain-containing protein [Phaeoacremonium minimum UCRPA7]